MKTDRTTERTCQRMTGMDIAEESYTVATITGTILKYLLDYPTTPRMNECMHACIHSLLSRSAEKIATVAHDVWIL
jgi:hypothetical protein